MRGAVKYMRSIQEIDRELERARQKMERSRKLDVILQDLKEQVGRRRQAEEEARAVLEKERGDVEELERMSLVSFLARIQGDLESRKAEERREAAMAKARYDAAKWDLEDLDRRFRDAVREKESLRGLEKQYQALLNEKEEVLHSQGGAQSQRLGQLAQEQERTAGELREIQEAIQAGLAAQRALEEMGGDLNGAENWGVWDMVGGGIMATFAKHGCLDDAQDAAYEARRALSRFRTELADVSSEQVPDVELGDFAAFADYFFDGLFAERPRPRWRRWPSGWSGSLSACGTSGRIWRRNRDSWTGSGSVCSPPRTGPSSRAERRQGRRSLYERAGDPSELDRPEP